MLGDLSREFMKWNYFTVTERSCNYPKPLELPLSASQEDAKQFVISNSTIPAGILDLKTAVNLVGSILGCYLHSSNIVNTGGCGRPGCDCGYDEEMGMIGFVGGVIKNMMSNKDYVNIVLVIHSMEAEKVRILCSIADKSDLRFALTPRNLASRPPRRR